MPESGTNLKAINIRLPAPAIAAAISPKSVGIVLEAKKRVAKVISMIKKLILNKISLTKPYYTKKKDTWNVNKLLYVLVFYFPRNNYKGFKFS